MTGNGPDGTAPKIGRPRTRRADPGDRHGNWTIVREVDGRRDANGVTHRYVVARCVCGTERTKHFHSLVRFGRIGCSWGCWVAHDGTAHRRGPAGSSSKLTAAQVLKIRADDRLLREIAADYNVSIGTISDIRRRNTWTHLEDPSGVQP